MKKEQDVYSSEVSELRTAYSTAVSELQSQIASSTDAHRHYSRRAGKLEAMAKGSGLKMLQKAVYRVMKSFVGVCLQRWCSKALDQAKADESIYSNYVHIW